MTDPLTRHARLAAMIAAYADRAPTAVDARAMTALAIAAAPRRRWALAASLDRRWVFALVVLGLLATMMTGLLLGGAGAALRRGPEDVLTGSEHIAPFVGLAPEGVVPSGPTYGELLVAFGGRFLDGGLGYYRMWLYDDGRFIWTSEEGAGGRTLANAVVQQWLTPEGVELFRAAVMRDVQAFLAPASVNGDRTRWGRPGVLWGSMTVAHGGELQDVEWGGRLPGILVGPESWLPRAAWADREIRAFVPARYAVCVLTGLSSGTVDSPQRPPIELERLLRAGTRMLEPGPACYDVPADTARTVAADFGYLGQVSSYIGPRLSMESTNGTVTFDVVPIVPHGQIVCNCG